MRRRRITRANSQDVAIHMTMVHSHTYPTRVNTYIVINPQMNNPMHPNLLLYYVCIALVDHEFWRRVVKISGVLVLQFLMISNRKVPWYFACLGIRWQHEHCFTILKRVLS